MIAIYFIFSICINFVSGKKWCCCKKIWKNWHIFRSFDRLWTFFILGLQVFNSTKGNAYTFIFPFIIVMTRLEHSYYRWCSLLLGKGFHWRIYFRRMSYIIYLVYSSQHPFWVCFKVWYVPRITSIKNFILMVWFSYYLKNLGISFVLF